MVTGRRFFEDLTKEISADEDALEKLRQKINKRHFFTKETPRFVFPESEEELKALREKVFLSSILPQPPPGLEIPVRKRPFAPEEFTPEERARLVEPERPPQGLRELLYQKVQRPLERKAFEAGPDALKLARQASAVGSLFVPDTTPIQEMPPAEQALTIGLDVAIAVPWRGIVSQIGRQVIKQGIKETGAKAFETALNTGLDKFIARQGRILPEARSRIGNLLVTDRDWLVEKASQNLITRMAEAKAQKTGLATARTQAVADTFADLEARIIPRGTQTGAMEMGGLPRPAPIISKLATPELTNRLKGLQAQASKAGFDLEAIQGIAPDEYWMSITRNSKPEASDLRFEWLKNIPKKDMPNEQLDKLGEVVEIVKGRSRQLFYPFKTLADAQKFLETGDTSLIMEKLSLQGEAWSPEKIAQTRQAMAGMAEREQRLRPLADKIRAKQNELAGIPEVSGELKGKAWTKANNERKAIVFALEAEIRDLQAQYTQARLKPELFTPSKPYRIKPYRVSRLTEEQTEVKLAALQAKMTPEEKAAFQISVKPSVGREISAKPAEIALAPTTEAVVTPEKVTPAPEVTRARPPARHEVPEFGEEGAIPPPVSPDVAKAGRRRIIEARLKRGEPVSDKLLAEFPDLQTKIVGGFVAPTPKGSVEQALETGLKQAKKTGENVYVFPTAEGMKIGKQPPPFRLQHYIAKPDGTYEYIKPAIPKAEAVPEVPAVAEPLTKLLPEETGEPITPAEQIKVIQAQGAANPESVGAEEAKRAHIEMAAPDGPRPPQPPVTTKPVSSDKPEDVMGFIVRRAIEGERPDQTLLRLHEAAISNEIRRVNLILQAGGKKLKRVGIGVIRKGQLTPREEDIPKLDQLFTALHNPSRVESGEIKVPKDLENIYAELRTLTDWEELARLDFDPDMATVVDYFYRGWKPPEGAFADILQGRPLVRTPSFKKPRVNASYEEMRESGFEPLFWNPYQQWGTARMQGVKYREQMELVDYLKKMGEEFIRPHDGGPIPQGWRVPEVGPAFEGKPFAYTNTLTGEPAVMYTRRWVVPDKIANSLENIYGKRPDLGKFVIHGKTIDPLSIIDVLTFLPKQAKLMFSFFQQVDFLTRAGAGAWTGAVDSLLAGHPIKAVSQVIRYPKTAAEIIQANFSPAKRRSLMEMLDDTTPLVKGRDGIHLKGISEAGLSTRDVTIFPADMDKLVREVANEAGVKKLPVRLIHAVGDLESAMRRGLFQGVYPTAQITDIKNNIAPMIARKGSSLTDEQINGMIAVFTNTKYSTLPAAQSVIQNRILRETLRRVFFSVGESEGLLRQATGGFHGPYRSFWRKHYIGAYLFLITTANIIHYASTGEPLPWERWSPIARNSWGPLPFGYNRDFASPTLPFEGRGGTELTLDLVGQMDTAFRILDPVAFLTARESVPIRAMVNQVSGTDFFGAPINDVGPGGIVSRSAQLFYDLFAPIGPGQSGLELLKSSVPGMEAILPRGESRLGMRGLLFQMTGINIRAETTPMLLDRYARESGLKKRDGTQVKSWADLEPHQKTEVQKNETLKEELRRRGTEAVITGSLPSARRVATDEIDRIFFQMEQQLANEFEAGVREPKDFVSRFNEIQSERANQKIGVMTVLEMMGYDRNLPPVDKREARIKYLVEHLPSDDMNERALGEYYLIFELARGKAGDINWDIYDGAKTFYEERWTPAQRSYVEDNTGLRDHPPLILEFIDAKAKLRPYWEIPELPRNQREAFRKSNPEIDAILVKWYGYKPVKGKSGSSFFTR